MGDVWRFFTRASIHNPVLLCFVEPEGGSWVPGSPHEKIMGLLTWGFRPIQPAFIETPPPTVTAATQSVTLLHVSSRHPANILDPVSEAINNRTEPVSSLTILHLLNTAGS